MSGRKPGGYNVLEPLTTMCGISCKTDNLQIFQKRSNNEVLQNQICMNGNNTFLSVVRIIIATLHQKTAYTTGRPISK